MRSLSVPTPRGPLGRAILVGALVVASLLAPLSTAIPAVRAITPPKVVIIVGPVGSTTASYRADADLAATEALKYTPNVVTIYSPNATWAAVKPELQGASVVIYMGHGNGFPSPHTSTLAPERQDGLGLNPTAGVDNSKTAYYGEAILTRDVQLAPNALVILGHLCYASGSSEPGYADPSQAVAQQRVDNYAAGFLAIGAKAVIAEAYNKSAAHYVSALFTSHDTVGNIWAASTSSQGRTFSFASTRTPGATVQMDPDKSSGKYYRSMTGDLSLTTDAVLAGAGTLAPPVDPAAPASPAPSPDPPTPSPTPSTPSTPTPSPDAGKASPGTALVATISAPAAFSPNGDGRQDTYPFKAKLTTAASWGLSITDAAGGVHAADTGTGSAVNVEWDGTSNGSTLGDGSYAYHLVATAPSGATFERSGTVRVDTVAPGVTVAPSVSPAVFSPNSDGSGEAWVGSYGMSEPGTLEATVVSSAGIVVRHLTAGVTAPASGGGPTGTLTWNGRTDSGSGVADGTYSVIVAGRDQAGNASPTQALPVVVYRALASVAASTTLFYPQDQDGYARSTRLSFRLTAPATVTWTITDAKGAVIADHYAAVAFPARSFSWVWNGTGDAGALVAPGIYAATLTVTNGILAETSRTSLTVAAFRIATAAATATRGRNVSVSVASAEPLASVPKLVLMQPGVAARALTMVRAANGTWRITTKLTTRGSAGKLTLKVSATDARGGNNVATTAVPLR